MGALEIILLLLGGIIFTMSFLIPSGAKPDNEMKKLVREEARKQVADEVDGARGQIEDMVEETVTYAVEKSERALERISNEKIMAVNEYSDTVLEDINKNHKEVMFLYDMLNDKHQNIKTTVSRVERTVRAAAQTVDEPAEQTADYLKTNIGAETVKQEEALKTEDKPKKSADKPQKTAKKKDVSFTPLSPKTAEKPDISFMKEGRAGGNNNDKILQMHADGKSNVAIAKELGLGVGEVKLVIDLFEGM